MSIVVAEFTISSDVFVLGQVLRNHEDVRVDLTQFVPLGDALVPYFWAETDDVRAFEESVRSDDRVASLTRLNGGHGRHLYSIEWATDIDGFIAAVTEHDLIVEAATGNHECWEFRVRGSGRDTLSSFQQTLRESDIPIQVERIWNPGDSRAEAYGVTAKQREALALAAAEGYFAVPRETNLTDLAEELDITRQSLSRRMARGQGTLLNNTLLREPPCND